MLLAYALENLLQGLKGTCMAALLIGCYCQFLKLLPYPANLYASKADLSHLT
jgi:hypothetical protein